MVSYSSVLRDLCGDKFYREFSVNPIVVHVSAAASSSAGVMNEANVNSLLLAALEQFKDQAAPEHFEDQATNGLLLFALEGYIRRLRHNTKGGY